MEGFPQIQELIAAISQGKESAFKALFNLYKDQVFSAAYAYTENRADAEEIVQEVFMRVWKNRFKLPEILVFPAWLHTITRNRCLSALKKKALESERKMELISSFKTSTTFGEAAADEREMQTILRAALKGLSPQQRKVFVMSRLQGLDRTTIAQKMGLAPATVSVHLTIALKLVKSYLTNSTNNVAVLLFLYLLLMIPA